MRSSSSQTEAGVREGRELRLGVSLLLASLVGAFFLFLASRAIPVEEVRHYLQGADWPQVARGALIFTVFYGLSHLARVWRWYYLVRPLGEVDRGEVNQVGLVGFAAILVIPLRLGEFIRPFLLASRSRLSAAGVLATVVVERVIDGLVVTGLLFLGLWTYQGETSVELVRGAGLIAAAIFVPALFICILAWRQRALAERLIMATAGRISERHARGVVRLVMHFVAGFNAVSRWRDLVPFLGLTGLYWFFNALSMWALLRFGFGLELGLWPMVTTMAVLVVGIMVPAGPAMVGNFEFFLAQGMGLFVSIDDALIAGVVGAFAATLHLLQVVIILVPAAVLMVRNRGLRLTRKALLASQKMGATLEQGDASESGLN